jgi:hypothetical protein
MALAAVKGQARSQRMFTALLQATEKERKAKHDSTLETAIEYKTQWEDELERRTALGIVGPDPIPHPDDVIYQRENWGGSHNGAANPRHEGSHTPTPVTSALTAP